jgi:phosphoglycolate phosphatase-like HAD superfamily hydrolase
MKPHRHRLQAALDALGAVAAESIYVGDTVSDVTAASGAGMPCIGYVNKPGKAEAVAASGAALVTTSMGELPSLL